jgi:MFS transporter, PPP family, 3-phenylpropionic acid transporter
MRLMSRLVPLHLAARAQAFYGTVAVGAMTALLTLLSGPLYQVFAARGFWLMAGFCATALLVTRRLPRADTAAAPPG